MLKKEVQQQLSKGYMLPLMEDFYTVQGEGAHSGTAAYFIRIGGCNIGCHWCDVKQSWDANMHTPTKIDQIVENVKKFAKIAVITGGEPLMWSLDYLTLKLRENTIKTHIETSGAYELSGIWDWVCLSPKKIRLPLDRAYKEADELKVIVYNKNDFSFAKNQAERVNKNCKLYLQAEWSNRKKMNPLIVDFILKNPEWKISLQTHKYLNIP